MTNVSRLLGFAFAVGDLLLEVDRSGTILFATGARTITEQDSTSLAGKNIADLFDAKGKAHLERHLGGFGRSQRKGPVELCLADGRPVTASFCHLPQNDDRISCVLKWSAADLAAAPPQKDASTGVATRDGFLADIAEAQGRYETLALIDLPDLVKACGELPKDEAGNLLKIVGQTLQTGAISAGRITETRFGVIGADTAPLNDLPSRLGATVRDFGLPDMPIEATTVEVAADGLTAEQQILAIRHVLDNMAEGKNLGEIPKNLGASFDAMLKQTMSRADALTSKLAAGAFELAFDLVVDLKTRETKHYEALVRFDADQSPASTVRFAEKLDLMGALDLAVAAKILSLVESKSPENLSLSLNLSARSIATSESFAMISRFLNSKRALAPRLLVEITESETIPDLASANRAIQELRGMGYRVGIDDFGAGAASLQYLHAFTVDFVKFDASLVQRIGQSARDDALLRGMLGLCRELGVKTVAEWIDSADRASRATELGFDLGQGKFFGIGLAAPRPQAQPAMRLRRRGVKESWG